MVMPLKERSNRNVFFIGLLSFFGGIGQDIFLPILPLYLADVRAFSKEFIGLAEGLVTAGVSLFRMVGGFLTDRFGKTKPFIFLGYALSLVARPLLAFTSSGAAVLGLRFFDGVGRGLKDSPKDALIADSTDIAVRGKGFGIVRMLDTFGSVVGPLALFVLLYFMRNQAATYHIVIVASALPLLATLYIVRAKLTDMNFRPAADRKSEAQESSEGLPVSFYAFLAISLLFGLGNSSDAFLILRAQNVGVTLLAIPLVYALFNFVYASASVPLGALSDRIGREKVIVLGWLAYAVAYLGFALANRAYHIWLLFAFYGLYYATTQGVAKAFVADVVGMEYRGRAYGAYNTALGLISLPASFIGGFLWDRIGPATTFFFGSGMALAATLFFLIFWAFRGGSRRF